MQDEKITALYVHLPEFDQWELNARVNYQLEIAHELRLSNFQFYLDVGGDPTSPFQPEMMNVLGGCMAGAFGTVIRMIDDSDSSLPEICKDETSEGVRFITLAYDISDETESDEIYDACAKYWQEKS